jgi:NADH pyrophosphatase NudC (nudix superfamily)
MEQEPILAVNDTAEVEDIGWFSLEEIKKMPCNRDVSSFLGMVSP